MSSIIDTFENLLKYNNKEVFIVLDVNNEIWFIIRKSFAFSYKVATL